jgi:hypothetical protein
MLTTITTTHFESNVMNYYSYKSLVLTFLSNKKMFMEKKDVYHNFNNYSNANLAPLPCSFGDKRVKVPSLVMY